MKILQENMRLIAECSGQLIRLCENLWGKEQEITSVGDVNIEPLDVPTMTTNFAKEHGLPCPEGYIFKDENGNNINATKIVLKKKKKEYPKTYEECREILKENADVTYGYKKYVLHALQKLLVCRDAYWKIAGDWNPEFRFGKKKYCIMTKDNKVISATVEETNRILVFPTEEMRDAFYENFKELIKSVKELL